MRKKIRDLTLHTLGIWHNPSKGIHILNGHYISKQTKDASVFELLLSNLSKKSTLIRVEEAVHLTMSRKKVNEPLIAFTFDDGYEECYTRIAPVLKHFNTNAAFFINPNFIECDDLYKIDFLKNRVFVENKNPMTWAMVKSLHKDGFIIGAHTMDHVRLNIADERILQYQITECQRVIEKKVEGPCHYFAYPYGQKEDISAEALELALKSYKYIFTGFNHKKYFSFNGRAINRRHFEGDWPILHMNYFLSFKKSY